MKFLSLLIWVGQFGLSMLFPTVSLLILGVWLQNRYDLGVWVTLLLGVVGILTSVSTTRACLQSLQTAAEEASNRKEPPIAFNDHK